MKKVISFFFILTIFPTTIFSNSQKIFLNIDHKYIKKFNETFQKICSTEKFFKNLTSHISYPKFGNTREWKKVCKNISYKKVDENYLIKKNFRIKSLSEKSGKLTGYYEPEVNVSKVKTSRYKIPILKYNDRFLGVKRASIIKKYKESDVLLWTDDTIDLFFLQIQGSGVGIFENGEKIKILYNGNNNLKYTSIGNILIKEKLLKKKNVNLFSIKKFLRENPKKIDSILNENGRYIFFKTSLDNKKGPLGAFGINLVSDVSIAVDKKYYPLGIPLLYKEGESQTFKPVFALDTGSAIKGENRADLFTGNGKSAEEVAGMLKKKLLLYVLVPYSN